MKRFRIYEIIGGDMYIATIDTGTTNTRVTIWDKQKPVCVQKIGVGVRVTSIENSNLKLLEGIRECLEEALKSSGIDETRLNLIVASGMIGSELGVCEIPRVTAPVSMKDLADSCVCKKIDKISRLHPIYFIPGVQNNVKTDSISKANLMDVMRGEEVETFGILIRENINGPAIVILPGSHTKFVFLNENNQITGCETTMAGEILMQLTTSTIISESLNASYVYEIEKEWLEAGADEAEKSGINRTAFKVRILDLFTRSTANQRCNYLLGAIIATDIKALMESAFYKNSRKVKILIGGTNSFSAGFAYLLKQKIKSDEEVRLLSNEAQANLAGYGALQIIKQKEGETMGKVLIE